ncbi:RNA polymerase subunit sigma-70 [Solitalea longa]|uniref:RNA polymerase subunit sigma-70 n=2 Tax=Solitalea longa TaxID=2079460 RepID=A0A2S5A687_9SPHI|nr:RNA polymerase subunit sigma-70 [Solitalea longa]
MVAYNTFTDQELFSLLKKADQQAFNEIYDRYWTPLYLHANRMLRDEDAAQDLVQDLFIWLFEKSEDLDINTSLSGFLYTAVRNRVFNAIKRNKLKDNYLIEIAAFADEMIDVADEHIHLKELAAIIEREIDFMPHKMKEVFNLSRKAHLSHKEIAEKLGISEHTVSTQIQRALLRLRKNKELQYAVSVIILNCFH